VCRWQFRDFPRFSRFSIFARASRIAKNTSVKIAENREKYRCAGTLKRALHEVVVQHRAVGRAGAGAEGRAVERGAQAVRVAAGRLHAPARWPGKCTCTFRDGSASTPALFHDFSACTPVFYAMREQSCAVGNFAIFRDFFAIIYLRSRIAHREKYKCEDC